MFAQELIIYTKVRNYTRVTMFFIVFLAFMTLIFFYINFIIDFSK